MIQLLLTTKQQNRYKNLLILCFPMVGNRIFETKYLHRYLSILSEFRTQEKLFVLSVIEHKISNLE